MKPHIKPIRNHESRQPGRSRNIYIDDISYREAKAIGDGSASAGIKKAIKAYLNSSK